MSGSSERGVVITVVGDSADVRVTPGSGCERCSSDCCHLDKDGLLVAGALNEIGARVGDEVEVRIPDGTDVRAGLIVYVLPVAALLFGYGAGNVLGLVAGIDRDLAGALGALTVVAGSLALLKMRGADALRGARYRPRLRAIIAPGLSPSPDDPGDRENGPHPTVER